MWLICTALRSAVPSSGSTARNTVNVLSIENYTRGSRGPRDARRRGMPKRSRLRPLLRVRTAFVTSAPGGYYDICDTTSCQVYGGAAAETSTTNDAVS